MSGSRTVPTNWPAAKGSYLVSDPTAPVAVCVLTSEELVRATAELAGVAISGSVQTANSGIEAIVLNTISNGNIRFLVVCGKESKLFRPGQSLVALAANGVDSERLINGAEGYEPRLLTVSVPAIARFREQVAVVDLRGEEDVAAIRAAVEEAVGSDPEPFEHDFVQGLAASIEQIKPGGHRQPLSYDPKGIFVITIEPEEGEIHLVHFGPDRLPAHEMRGRSAEPMLLGLLRERLISQLSHAGYLGGELAKAESALRLGLPYIQDRPLREASKPSPSTTTH